MTADQLTLLVAEDHPLDRRVLTTLLVGQDGWDVVAEAEDGIGAVTAAQTMQPDVVLVDLNLPGLDRSRRHGELWPPARISQYWC